MVKHPAGCPGLWIYYVSVDRSSHIAPTPATHRIPAPAALNPWELSWDVTFAIPSWSLIPAKDQRKSILVVFSGRCSALAPSLQLLTSQKTSGCLGTRGIPGHISMMPDGKVSDFRSTLTMSLLHTSLMWPSVPTPSTIREEQVSQTPHWEGMWSAVPALAAPGLRLCNSRAPKSRRRQSSGVIINSSFHPWNSLACCFLESHTFEKLPWPPCQGYTQPNTLCPILIASASKYVPHPPRPTFGSVLQMWVC